MAPGTDAAADRRARADKREVLVTYVLDAEPDHRYPMPGPSLWPFLTAVATTVLFIWSIF